MKTVDNTCIIHFLVSISILFTSSTSFSSDLFLLGLRKNSDGTFSNTERLVCQSPASALEKLNHSLYIPTCNSEKSEPKILSEHLPVSAIFVSCRQDTVESCSNIVRSVISNKTGATVNILVNANSFTSDMINSLGEIKQLSLKNNSPLNIIPLKTPVPVYMRDSGIFSQGNEGDIKYTSNPYSLHKAIGDTATSELSEKCGYRFDKITVKNDTAKINYAIKFTINFEGGDSSLYGGNFMALPNETLIVGENDRQSPDPELLTYFKNKQKILKLKIPKLAVGHIDEVFRIIPSDNSCGFSILYASPQEMKIFLQGRPKNEIISRATSRSDLSEEHPEFMKTYSKTIKKIKKLKNKNLAIAAGLANQMDLLERKLGALSFQNETVGSLLQNKALMRTWERNENLIRKSVDLIVQDIQENKTIKCLPTIVPMPVYWNSLGEPLIPNPVNASTINGKYFYSKASREYYGNIMENPNNSLPYEKKK